MYTNVRFVAIIIGFINNTLRSIFISISFPCCLLHGVVTLSSVVLIVFVGFVEKFYD